jgi:hypothetical protein
VVELWLAAEICEALDSTLRLNCGVIGDCAPSSADALELDRGLVLDAVVSTPYIEGTRRVRRWATCEVMMSGVSGERVLSDWRGRGGKKIVGRSWGYVMTAADLTCSVLIDVAHIAILGTIEDVIQSGSIINNWAKISFRKESLAGVITGMTERADLRDPIRIQSVQTPRLILLAAPIQLIKLYSLWWHALSRNIINSGSR